MAWSGLIRNPMFEGKINMYYSDQLYCILQDHYTEKHRHYHNIRHIVDSLSILYKLTKADIKFSNLVAMKMAIFFHDIVYNTNRSKYKYNTYYSANKFIDLFSKTDVDENFMSTVYNYILSMDTDIDFINRISNCALSTGSEYISTHQNEDIDYLHDIDHAYLGYDWKHFKCISKNISKEFPWYFYPVFKFKRKKFLQELISYNKLIYRTNYFYNNYEAKARLNIKRAIS
jgi:predicted metal-dependent HD superfamily phosphohydrolase